MGNIDLTVLEIFKTVAEQGGIAKAAGRSSACRLT